MENRFSEKRIEQEIGWHKVLFTVLAALDASLVAWFVKNYASTSAPLNAVTLTAIMLITFEIILTYIKVFDLLKQLDKSS